MVLNGVGVQEWRRCGSLAVLLFHHQNTRFSLRMSHMLLPVLDQEELASAKMDHLRLSFWAAPHIHLYFTIKDQE